MYLSTNLQYLLDLNKMSASDLANQLGISQPAVSKWLNTPQGEMPSVTMHNLIKISELFNVSLDDLLKKDLASGADKEIPLTQRVDEAMKTLKDIKEQLKKGRHKFKSFARPRLTLAGV